MLRRWSRHRNTDRTNLSGRRRHLAVRATGIFLVLGCSGDPGPASPAIVAAVVDGDTIDVTIDGHLERVRLIGIDTPEVAHGSEAAECGGEEASRFLEYLLPIGSNVVLHRDVVARDHYGRLLAYVDREADDLNINLMLAAAGYATPLAIPPNTTLQERIAEVYGAARTARAGIWSSCE